jgi:hypothetical protein
MTMCGWDLLLCENISQSDFSMSALLTSAEVRQHFSISERTLQNWRGSRAGFPPPVVEKSGRSPAQWDAAAVLEYSQSQPTFIKTPSFQCFSTVALEEVFSIDRRTLLRWPEQLDFPAPRIAAQSGRKPVVGASLIGTQKYWHIIDILRWLDRLDSLPYSFCTLRYKQIMDAYLERFAAVRTHVPPIGARVNFFIEFDGEIREMEGRVTQPFVASDPPESYSIPGTITIDFLFSNRRNQVQIPLWRLVAGEQ